MYKPKTSARFWVFKKKMTKKTCIFTKFFIFAEH